MTVSLFTERGYFGSSRRALVEEGFEVAACPRGIGWSLRICGETDRIAAGPSESARFFRTGRFGSQVFR